jgi:NAD(P)-dependent dehydrogenase (short-subunit alcohol dehydrogenase family)
MYLAKYDLKGRTAVVTGGGRGIGLAGCQALAEAGAKVVIADFDAKVAAEGQAELNKAGFKADVAQLDVTKPDTVTACADALNKRHGAVDILVANAGIARSGTGGEEVSGEQWLNVIDVNLNGGRRLHLLVGALVGAAPRGRLGATTSRQSAFGPTGVWPPVSVPSSPA